METAKLRQQSMSTASSKSSLTPEQYEAIEERSEIRHEYYRGEMFAMAGATENHNLISGSIFFELRSHFTGRPCKVYQPDMRVRVAATGLYTYPDVVAVCGPGVFTTGEKTTLLNPTVVFEVLSPSTETYDRSTKLDHYRTVESLHEIVLVAQDRVRIDLLRRAGDQWVWMSLLRLDDLLHLESIGCEVPVASIYAQIEVPEIPLLRPIVRDEEL
jgi:Uma2 family endonuclease